MKIALYFLGGLVALFVGSVIVVAILDGLGVIETSEDVGQSSESKPAAQRRIAPVMARPAAGIVAAPRHGANNARRPGH